MSTTARFLIAFVCILCGVCFAAMPLALPPGTIPNPGVAWIVAGVCFIFAAACLPGRVGNIAGRVTGALICLAYVTYVISQIGKPLPALATYRRSDENIVNALLGFVFFGIPGGCFAIFGRFAAPAKQPAPSVEMPDFDLDTAEHAMGENSR